MQLAQRKTKEPEQEQQNIPNGYYLRPRTLYMIKDLLWHYGCNKTKHICLIFLKFIWFNFDEQLTVSFH